MITSVSIDGFRSLSSFEMDLRPGVNILIGPNGSGKTNIILFFEFLAGLFSDPIGVAINKNGGVGYLFRRKEGNKIVDNLSFSVSGSSIAHYSKFELRHVNYEYTADITFLSDLDIVFFKSQTLKVSSSKRKGFGEKWDLVLSADAEIRDGRIKSKVTLQNIDFRKSNGRFFSASQDGGLTKIQRLKQISENLSNLYDGETSIIGIAYRLMDEVRELSSDFQSGKAINILPSIVKQSEDSATPAGIRRDGGGLSATLYALKRLENQTFRRRSRPIYSPLGLLRYSGASRSVILRRGLFGKIEEYLRLVNDEIVGIDVEKDHVDNQLRILVKIKGEDDAIDLPISFMSDGTVKWLSIVTAILTTPDMFAIEEPENFIHPLMQEEIIKLMREVSRSGSRDDFFVLMTTHSETLLNASSPSEIVVVDMCNGVTRAHRLNNEEEIRSAINETGFGLGFMYLSGVLGD